MPLLVREGVEGHAQGLRQDASLRRPSQETGHIGPFHRPGLGAGADSGDVLQKASLPQLRKALGQILYVLEQRLILPQPQFTGLDGEQLGAVVPAAVGTATGGGGGVVAGVDPQETGHAWLPPPDSSLRTKEPKMPLTKEATLGSSYFFASSTASLMAAEAGISGI